jgi:hypothetical protein
MRSYPQWIVRVRDLHPKAVCDHLFKARGIPLSFARKVVGLSRTTETVLYDEDAAMRFAIEQHLGGGEVETFVVEAPGRQRKRVHIVSRPYRKGGSP